MSISSFTKMKSTELIEILAALSVVNNVSEKLRMHLNGECEIDNVDELANFYVLGGLGASIKYLAKSAAFRAEWIEQNSTDLQS
ncbi:hypothetical protein AU255_09180 [Methyloprofundus sedimenti]|uniref:Uncharacterized protein n=1 Tax=Methyloprofundus sedimenti TaxID=1420851 RepID=A0A1V8M8T4_9GAMM|nr:hypothetical protein [Methyloprofundus sedimenti]OQK18010.1 hypothetical protein AU255_09180 [Methyloprofundus sedimenti]